MRREGGSTGEEEEEGSGVSVVRESANYRRELILVPLIAIGFSV